MQDSKDSHHVVEGYMHSGSFRGHHRAFHRACRESFTKVFTTRPGEKNHPLIPYSYAWVFTNFTVCGSLKYLNMIFFLENSNRDWQRPQGPHLWKTRQRREFYPCRFNLTILPLPPSYLARSSPLKLVYR